MHAHGERLRVLIVDDEPLARDLIRRLLAEDVDIGEVTEATGTDAVEIIRETQPEVLFLDIEMPEIDGFTVVERIGVETVPAIVFVTGYDRHALRAFEVHALDYLLKPVDDRRFADALARAKARAWARRRGDVDARVAGLMAERGVFQSRFLVRDRGKTVVVLADEIDWIEAEDYYASLHVTTASGSASYLVRETMEQLEKRLDPSRFVRVHRSAIVNVERVREVHALLRGDCMLVLDNATRVKLSRSRRKRFDVVFARAPGSR